MIMSLEIRPAPDIHPDSDCYEVVVKERRNVMAARDFQILGGDVLTVSVPDSVTEERVAFRGNYADATARANLLLETVERSRRP